MSSVSNPGTALVTGASTGIGAIYARRFAQRGYNLILVARDHKRLLNLADEIAGETGRKVEVFAADLTVKTDLKRVEGRLRSDTNITALVNNAGFAGAAKLIESNIDEMENMIQ
ncbi:MAG: SDR family NAD(P)-dependent oxidoreductase, partial [Acidobacteria bacterium]|nr:SDR family NAD(P)-dependent oxidoreductase [Acidobacteriota bacterium]